MTVFTAAFSAVAISAAQDLFEIVAPADAITTNGSILFEEIGTAPIS